VKISCAVLFSETRDGCSAVMTLVDSDLDLEDVGKNQAHLSFLFSGAHTQHAIILWTVWPVACETRTRTGLKKHVRMTYHRECMRTPSFWVEREMYSPRSLVILPSPHEQ
jgi:hypothetical protein